MGQPDLVVISLIVLFVAAMVRVRQQRGRYLNELDLQGQEIGSQDRQTKPDLISAPVCPQQPCVNEAVADRLTELKSHRAFMEALEEEWQLSAGTGRQSALILIELDRFKRVNNRLGRLEGDEVLIAVAVLLDGGLKQPHVFGRYGPDEFVVLMPQTNVNQARDLAEELRAGVEKDGFLCAHEVTESSGITTFPHHGLTLEKILKLGKSDILLEAGKFVYEVPSVPVHFCLLFVGTA